MAQLIFCFKLIDLLKGMDQMPVPTDGAVKSSKILIVKINIIFVFVQGVCKLESWFVAVKKRLI